MKVSLLSRAKGCLLGHLAGDALGSLVEFKSPAEIRALYPAGVCEMADGGTFNTVAGQATDDGELMLTLAHALSTSGGYDPEYVFKRYRWWLASGPFDCGTTTRAALTGRPNGFSQANGALMRAAALGIFCYKLPLEETVGLARLDCALTHPNAVAQDANALYVLAIAYAVRTGCSAEALYAFMLRQALDLGVTASVAKALREARTKAPKNLPGKTGWVLVAFQNAVYQMLHAPDFETALVRTIALGYDTDTNAAIAGALCGAVAGKGAIPRRWVKALMKSAPGGFRPRPKSLWPRNAVLLVAKLLAPNTAA